MTSKPPVRYWKAIGLSLALGLAACSGTSEQDYIAAAKEALEKKDAKAAVIQLKNALQKNGNSGEARLLLGQSLLKEGDVAGALVELRKAQELQVPDEQVLPLLAQAMVLAGEEAKLIAQFETLQLKDALAQADFKTSLATAHAVQNDGEKARAAVAEALRAKPGHAPALIVSARLAAAGNDVAGAITLLNQVLTAEPTHERAGVLKGELLHLGQGDVSGAMAAYRQVLSAHPASVSARAALTNILLRQDKLAEARAEFEELKKAAPQHPETLLFEAQFAFGDKDYKKARELTEQVLRTFPNSVRVLEVAGAAEYRLKNYIAAEALLTKALKLAPQQRLSRLLLAQTYLRNGEPAKTLEALKPLLEAAAVDGGTLSLAGEAHLQLGDAVRSEQAFQAALKAAPDDARVRTAAAMAQIARGNHSGAIVELEAVAAADSGPRADLALVSARMRQNDIPGALKAIDGLEKKLPDEALPLQLRGRLLTLKNDLPGAIRSFEAALAKEPGYFPPVASLAALDMLAKKPEEARKRFNAFIQAQPKSWQARMALAELEARAGAPAATVTAALREAVKVNPIEPQPHVGLVNHLIATGEAKAALLAAQDASAALPNSMEVMDTLGRAELAAGDQQRALSTFKKLAGLQPRSALPELRLAETYAAMKDSEQAGRALRRAAELQPGNLAVTRAQARLAMADGRPEDALKVARELQKRAPQDAYGHTLEGEIEVIRKNWDAAIAAHRAALRLAPSSDGAAKLHTALLAARKPADAARLAADWVKNHPRDASFPYFLGDVALAQGDLPRAEAHYRTVLAMQADNALALNNVAWLLVKQGKPGALALAQRANQLLPDRAPLIDTLSAALESENKISEAIEAQKRAITLAPRDHALGLRLAKLYIKAGDKTRARGELDALTKLGDKFVAQPEVAELLRSL